MSKKCYVLFTPRPITGLWKAPRVVSGAAGFRVGSLYNGGGGTTYIVAPYQSGSQFAVSWGQRKLRALCTSIKVTGNRARPELSQQINAFSRGIGMNHDFGDATFACDKSGMAMTAYVFAGTTLIRGAGQGGIWYGDTIEAFLAPTPVAGLAAGLLAHMIKSVRVNPAWVARQTQTNADVSHIAAQTNAAISDSLMRGWEERGAVMDRVMQEGSRTRLGIDVYADPATGTQYTVANSHRYYWVNASGTVVGTDTDTAQARRSSASTACRPNSCRQDALKAKLRASTEWSQDCRGPLPMSRTQRLKIACSHHCGL